MLDLIAILITKLILSLQATIIAIIYLAIFLIIRSRIRLTKVVKIVPLAIKLLMLLIINLEQKVTNAVENLRVIIAPQIISLGSLILLSPFSAFKFYISYLQFTPPLDIAAALVLTYITPQRDIPCLTWEDLYLRALQLVVLHIFVYDFN